MKIKTHGKLADNILFFNKLERSLKQARVLSPRVEAEWLIEHFGGVERLAFFTGEAILGTRQKSAIETILKKRRLGYPMAQLLKEAFFYGKRFFVSEDTLIPRPETEFVIEETLQLLDSCQASSRPRLLDIGTGSACISVCLTIERPNCRMTALDVSPEALKIARKNIRFHGLGKKIKLVQSDLFSVFGEEKKGFWDIIVSNPPYIPSRDLAGLSIEVKHEPSLALDGGASGLQVIKAILDQAHYFLKPDGWLLVEIGIGQSGILGRIHSKSPHYKNLRFVKDFSGIDRVLIVQHG